jgi:hypothetical protein
MDTAKRYFTRLGMNELNVCKIVSKMHKVCRQNQPVQLTHLDEVCEAQMIETIRSIAASCSQRIVELNHTLWTQLDHYEWIFVATTIDVLTVLCLKHEPTDIKLIGTGKVHINSMCKAYGNRILIQSHATFVSNRTSKDIIPPLSLEYDCCDSVDKTIILNELHLQIPLRSVTNSFVDL